MLKPLKTLIDNRARINESNVQHRKHYVNIYTNFIKLLYVYAYNEATLQSAFIEFPVNTYNPYKRDNTIRKPEENIIKQYVNYIMDKSPKANDSRKDNFNSLVERILEKKHHKIVQKVVRVGTQILKGAKISMSPSGMSVSWTIRKSS